MSKRLVSVLKASIIVCLLAIVGYVSVLGLEGRPLASGQAPEAPQPIVTAATPGPPPTGWRVAVIGDSYTGGSAAGGFPPFDWPTRMLQRLEEAGITAEANVSGRGGSGYVTRGTEGTVFGKEVAKVVRPDDRLVIFFGSMNDGMVPPEQLQPAVDAAFAEAKQIAPNAALLVIAPVWPQPDPPPGILAVRDVLRTATEAYGGTFVDPLSEGWLLDRPDMIGLDGIHPTTAGHEVMAQLIGDRVVPILQPQT